MPSADARCRDARGARRPAGALESEVMAVGRERRCAGIPGGGAALRAGERPAPRAPLGAGD